MPQYKNVTNGPLSIPVKDGEPRTVQAGEDFEADAEAVGALIRQGSVIDPAAHDKDAADRARALGVSAAQATARREEAAGTAGAPQVANAERTPSTTGVGTTTTAANVQPPAGAPSPTTTTPRR